jgi:hypothetical protein
MLVVVFVPVVFLFRFAEDRNLYRYQRHGLHYQREFEQWRRERPFYCQICGGRYKTKCKFDEHQCDGIN